MIRTDLIPLIGWIRDPMDDHQKVLFGRVFHGMISFGSAFFFLP